MRRVSGDQGRCLPASRSSRRVAFRLDERLARTSVPAGSTSALSSRGLPGSPQPVHPQAAWPPSATATGCCRTRHLWPPASPRASACRSAGIGVLRSVRFPAPARRRPMACRSRSGIYLLTYQVPPGRSGRHSRYLPLTLRVPPTNHLTDRSDSNVLQGFQGLGGIMGSRRPATHDFRRCMQRRHGALDGQSQRGLTSRDPARHPMSVPQPPR